MVLLWNALLGDVNRFQQFQGSLSSCQVAAARAVEEECGIAASLLRWHPVIGLVARDEASRAWLVSFSVKFATLSFLGFLRGTTTSGCT